MKTERIHKGILWTVIGITVLLVTHTVLSIYFYRFYQEPPITYRDIHFREGSIIKQGSTVEVSVDRCAKANYHVTVYRSFEDTILWEFAPLTDQTIMHGCVTATRSMRIPVSVGPGAYVMKIKTIVEIDWLYFSKTRIVQFQTEQFTIVK